MLNAILDSLHDNNPSYNSLNDDNWDGTYISTFSIATSESTVIYSVAYSQAEDIDWLAVVKEQYPEAIINSDIELFNIYNQYDLLIGLAIRTTINQDGVDKVVYLKE